MRSPLRLSIALRSARLPVARPVELKVLRLAAGIDHPRLRGFGVLSLPVAVVDRGREPPRYQPVVDLRMLTALVGSLVAAWRLGSWMRHRDKRRNQGGNHGIEREHAAHDQPAPDAGR